MGAYDEAILRSNGMAQAAAQLDQQLSGFVQSAVALERQRRDACRVDGLIVGTGQRDFTKDNVSYTLRQGHEEFQLIDVPGIEGDEQKYAPLVEAAVAKAHLVFYVNGTNKKPEKETAEKIGRYLRRGSQVCPVVNVRGLADAYEFDEDREGLRTRGLPGTAMKQTMEVLRETLSDDVLLPGLTIQGMMAFSGLAMLDGATTIHPSRDDLLARQRGLLACFDSPTELEQLSRIDKVAAVLRAKARTFREDIVESNKVKVRELLAENIALLQAQHDNHSAFVKRLKPEFKKCKAAIEGALDSFERVLRAGRSNAWNEFFNRLSNDADDIVADNFGDNDEIDRLIKRSFRTRRETTEKQLTTQLEQQQQALQENLEQALNRLMEDVRRVDFEHRAASQSQGASFRLADTGIDMDLDLKDWGRIAFDIGSYAATGFAIGSAFPGIGNAIGAIAGAVVGALVSLAKFFTSRESRIRKAQAQVRDKIDDLRHTVMGRIDSDTATVVTTIRNAVEQDCVAAVDQQLAHITGPLAIIKKQLALMTRIKQLLEQMPHGTIQAIRTR